VNLSQPTQINKDNNFWNERERKREKKKNEDYFSVEKIIQED